LQITRQNIPNSRHTRNGGCEFGMFCLVICKGDFSRPPCRDEEKNSRTFPLFHHRPVDQLHRDNVEILRQTAVSGSARLSKIHGKFLIGRGPIHVYRHLPGCTCHSDTWVANRCIGDADGHGRACATLLFQHPRGPGQSWPIAYRGDLRHHTVVGQQDD
jgi:hypothetical protein